MGVNGGEGDGTFAEPTHAPLGLGAPRRGEGERLWVRVVDEVCRVNGVPRAGVNGVPRAGVNGDPATRDGIVLSTSLHTKQNHVCHHFITLRMLFIGCEKGICVGGTLALHEIL